MVSQNQTFRSQFYLTGGTALAGYYFNHRVSLNLDFFSSTEINLTQITHLLFTAQKSLRYRKITRDPQQGENRFILTFTDRQRLTLDFVYYPFSQVKKGPLYNRLRLDSLADIAVNKFDTIHTRQAARDYVDLYVIMQKQHFSLAQIRRWHQRKIQHFIEPLVIARRLLQINEITDLPLMKIPFNRPKMIKFYENLALSLEPQIFQ